MQQFYYKKFDNGGNVLPKSSRDLPKSSQYKPNHVVPKPIGPSKNKFEFCWKLWSYNVDIVEDEPVYRNRLFDLAEFRTLAKLETSGTMYLISDAFVESDIENDVYRSCSYCFFKSEIEPVWEDDGNYNGGRFVANIYSQPEEATIPLGSYWEDLLEILVNGGFDQFTNHICGAKVLYKPESMVNTISLWTTEDVYKSPLLQRRIRHKFESIFNENDASREDTAVYVGGFEPHQKRNGYNGHVEILTKSFWVK